ncbi:MAG: PPC domain-containing protein, partial [Planctomycetales bacterium]|nr:PPC domain-containing protein [Planctomycetales bacterium]
PLAQVAEVEPNSDFATPQVVGMETTIHGVIQSEDVDYFAVDLAEGQAVTLELEGLRLGTEFFDPYIAILDENRFELVASDDAPLLQQDCVCALRAPRDGRYVIEVRESSFGGNARCQYRLHVGDFPRPLAIVPAGGRPGEVIEATLIDALGESWQEKIQLPAQVGEFDYVAVREGKSAPSPNRLRVRELTNTLASEPDTDHAALAACEAPVAFNGVLQEPGDVDWFKIRGQKNQQLEFTVYGRRVLRSPLDSWLEIHKSGGGRLAANDDAGSPDSQLNFKFPEDGEYLIAIRDQLHEGSPIHAYRIEVAPAEASLALTIDELQRYISQTVEVPRGGQMAVVLRAQRANFGGELALRLENAPPGLELVTPTIAASQSFIPMLLKAAADAPLGAALAPLVAETPPDGAAVRGTLDQRTLLVHGQNNRDVWGHNAQRLAVAVTKELPFAIEVVPPEVPLVRNGSSHFVVKATRQEGYQERIDLRVLYNPPGCSASGSVRIEPDKSEALIPVTANASAGLGNYPITILARAKVSNANVWLASEFVDLEVADSFFDFKFVKTVAETGSSSQILVGVDVKRPPEGEVTFELLGLPAGVTSAQSVVRLEEGMTQLSFPIDVAADARVGQFKVLVIKATITRPAGTIVQTQGTGELQLAAPLPTANPVAAAAASQPTPPPATAAAKPLSRLEQLRQAKQQEL